MPPGSGTPLTVWTIGHSTRSLDAFVELLREHAITHLVDIRRFPASRRHPHFAGAALSRALAERGVRYTHEVDLGGHRKPEPGSPNLFWQNEAFRGYADHLRTDAFRAALSRLEDHARLARTVVLCAEAVPWRCHRQILADALVARGLEVRHILGPGPSRAHELRAEARVESGVLVYPAGQPSLF
jgi:uncharacterized protein (DUF488 family)